jgi:hypothetical protein
MDTSTLFIVLAALACPIGMGLMMWMMNKNMSEHPGHAPSGDVSAKERLGTLREERRLLELELEEVEKIAALEAEKEAIARGMPPGGQLQPVEGARN